MDLNWLQVAVKMDPAKFIAEEDINRPVDESKASEGVSCNDETVKTSNLSSARQQDNLQLKKKQQVVGTLK